MSAYRKRILLFSSARSGSTLIANILRSNPHFTYYNEIFTRAPHLLPNFESAFQANAPLCLPFETDLARLAVYKLQFGGNLLHRSRLIKTAAFLGLKAIASLLNWMPFDIPKWNPFHKIYHLNSLHEPPLRPFWATQFRKASSCEILFIKDVRMVKAYYAFKQMYPDAYFIYLVRNPYFVVASELRHRSIENLMKWVDPDFLRRKYQQPGLVEAYFGKTPEQTLALLWRLENELIWNDIQADRPAHLFLLRFEDFVGQKTRFVDQISAFLNLPVHQQTTEFLKQIESYSGKQKHNRSTFVRQQSFSSMMSPSLSPGQLSQISEVLDGIRVPEEWIELNYDAK